MFIIVVTGVLIMLFNPDYAGGYDLGSLQGLFLLVKHILVVVLIIIGIYFLEVLSPKMGRAGAKGPSPEAAKLQALQLRLGITGFVVMLLILFSTAITSVAS